MSPFVARPHDRADDRRRPRGEGIRRRAILVGLGAVLVLAMPGTARAQDAEDVAAAFVADLVRVAEGGDGEAVKAFLRDRVDLAHALGRGLDPVADLTTEGQRQRLAALMLETLADEALVTAALARDGEFRVKGLRPAPDGTLVEAVFRGAAGDRPFSVLVEDGRVRDMGSPETGGSVVARLGQITQGFAGITRDPEVWIGEWERTVGAVAAPP